MSDDTREIENESDAVTDVVDTPEAQDPDETEGNDAGGTEPTNTADAVRKALEGDDDPQGEKDDAEEGDSDGNDSVDKASEEGEDEDGGEDEGQDDEADMKPPEGLSDGARKRFETLVGRVKEATAAAAEQKAHNEQIIKVMEDTGAKPDEFAQHLVMLGHANSGDPDRVSQALEMLDGFRSRLARQVGKPVAGVDVLSDFPDLRKKVDEGYLDEESAAEIATARRGRDAQSQQRQQQQQKQTQETQMAERVTQAQAGLNDLGKTLKAKDPDYDQKLQILSNRGFFDNVAKTAPPEQWGQLFQISYDALGDVAKTRTPVNKAAAPMRSNPSGGGGNPRPKTTAEAVRMALAEE